MAHSVSSIARGAHVKALTRSLKPEPRVQALSQFSWRIQPVPEGNLILPDCVAVAIQSNGNGPQPYIMAGADEIDAVLCPICSNRLLVGRKGDVTLPDVQGFNEAAADCSHTFFVSATRTSKLEKLTERIGKRSEATMQDVVASAVNEFTAKSTTHEDLSQSVPSSMGRLALPDTTITTKHHGKGEVNDAQNSAYIVIFRDCADEDTAQKIADVVDVVVSEMDPSVPLGRLDSITFAGDYVTALQNMERGFPTSRPLVPTEEDWGVGVAMAPLVIRDGVTKISIVMHGWLGHALIGEDRGADDSHTYFGQSTSPCCLRGPDLSDYA